MPELVIHTLTNNELKRLAKHPVHAILLTGAEGTGKMAIAEQLGREVLQLEAHKQLIDFPYAKVITPEGQSISIEAIRELLQFTKLKIASSESVQRVIVIAEAPLMTTEAQNALLKLLEEPPEGTLFILTANNAQRLLPTIRSRVQELAVKQPERERVFEHFATQGFDAKKVQQAYLMSGGLPGLMHALLHESDHPLTNAAQQARELLQAKPFERLARVDALAKQKTELLQVLFILQQMARAALEQSVSKGNAAISRWQKILAAAYDAEKALLASAQPKLVLTNLMLVL